MGKHQQPRRWRFGWTHLDTGIVAVAVGYTVLCIVLIIC